MSLEQTQLENLPLESGQNGAQWKLAMCHDRSTHHVWCDDASGVTKPSLQWVSWEVTMDVLAGNSMPGLGGPWGNGHLTPLLGVLEGVQTHF